MTATRSKMATRTRTAAQRIGDAAEALVAAGLEADGWRILARNLRLGRAELDLLAVDPGPPPRLVVVEVRSRRRQDFGLAEESFDHRKQAHVRVGVARLLGAGHLPSGLPLPALPVAVDLIVVAPGRPGDPPRIRHLRDVLDRDR